MKSTVIEYVETFLSFQELNLYLIPENIYLKATSIVHISRCYFWRKPVELNFLSLHFENYVQLNKDTYHAMSHLLAFLVAKQFQHFQSHSIFIFYDGSAIFL